MASQTARHQLFSIVFLVLTFFCWCPLGYGQYGEVPMILGMPSWAFYLMVIGLVLFVLEWVYLFQSDLALYDDDLDRIIAELEQVGDPQTTEKEV